MSSKAHPTHPLVSIVIPVYNGSNFLHEAIESAMSQTYQPIEIIVVNDGSTDDGATRRVAERYGSSIRYFEKENGGVSTALNIGIREMRGDYFSWLSHDDVYPPEKIEGQIEFLSDKPEGSCAYGDVQYIDEKSVLQGRKRFGRNDRVPFLYRLVVDGLHGCSALIPRPCFDAVGLFREDLKVIQDIEMWARIGARFPFLHEPEIRVLSRQHSKQGSQNFSRMDQREIERFYTPVIPTVLRESRGVAQSWAMEVELLDSLWRSLVERRMIRPVLPVLGRLCSPIRSGWSARRLRSLRSLALEVLFGLARRARARLRNPWTRYS